MPSFSLTVYKNTFTGLGTDINEAHTHISVDQMDIRYNDAELPDENGDVITTGDTSTKGGS